MKIQLKINNEELLLLSNVDRLVWREEQVAILSKMIDESGLSLRELAEKCDIAHSYIDRLRKHTGAVNKDLLLRLLTALNQTLYSVYKPPVIEFNVNTADTVDTKTTH